MKLISFASMGIVFTRCPMSVRTAMYVVFMMITVDTCTGIIAAIACRELRSAHMRQKLVMKSLQYTILFTIPYAATILSGSWIFFELGIAAIASIEATSMLENLVIFQEFSGVNLGPATGIIHMLSGYFQLDKNTTIVRTSTATVSPNEDTSPVVSVTTTETSTSASRSKI